MAQGGHHSDVRGEEHGVGTRLRNIHQHFGTVTGGGRGGGGKALICRRVCGDHSQSEDMYVYHEECQ